jgi:hypothetical protein
MLSAILILLIMPFTDLNRSRGIQFRPLSKLAFYIFVANFLILMVLGAKHVESPFIEFGQISTVIYFAHFLMIVPLVSIIENSLMDLSFNSITSKTKHNIVLAGLSLPVLILITIGTVSGELSITIASNIDVSSLVDTTLKAAIHYGSDFLTTGLDLCLKSVPFMVEQSLNLIISPVNIPSTTILDPSVSSLRDTLQQINNLNVEFANLLTEYLRLVPSNESNREVVNLGFQIAGLREQIGGLLSNLKILLASLGASFNELPILNQDIANVDFADTLRRIPNIPVRIFNFDFLGHDLTLALVRDGFNILESEFYILLGLSFNIISGYSGVF